MKTELALSVSSSEGDRPFFMGGASVHSKPHCNEKGGEEKGGGGRERQKVKNLEPGPPHYSSVTMNF